LIYFKAKVSELIKIVVYYFRIWPYHYHATNGKLSGDINFLEAYNMEIGLLINFGNVKLQFKRVMKPLGKVLGPTIDSI